MARALELAARGGGFTSPNPLVGALIVRGGEVVGEGYHACFGGPHAEAVALKAAGERARDATLYVTLEPCCVWGKTPPCTEAIIQAGVTRIVVAAEDPNPAVSGRGLAALRDAGLVVDVGVLAHEAQSLNRAYVKFRRTGLPHVTLKMAMSFDGRVPGPGAADSWITSEASRRAVHAMRGESDCVMIGIGTVLADDPLLTDRRPEARRQPTRLVLDGRLSTPPDSALARTAREQRTVVACRPDHDPARAGQLRELGVAVWPCAADVGGLDLEGVLRKVGEAGLLSVLCEGGPRVAASVLEAGLVDRVAFFIAPRLVGSGGQAAFGSLRTAVSSAGGGFEEALWREVGPDVLFEARMRTLAEHAPARRMEGCSQGSSKRSDGSSG